MECGSEKSYWLVSESHHLKTDVLHSVVSLQTPPLKEELVVTTISRSILCSRWPAIWSMEYTQGWLNLTAQYFAWSAAVHKMEVLTYWNQMKKAMHVCTDLNISSWKQGKNLSTDNKHQGWVILGLEGEKQKFSCSKEAMHRARRLLERIERWIRQRQNESDIEENNCANTLLCISHP